MVSPADYLEHEFTYRSLKADGHPGWGGEALTERMEGWNLTVQKLLRHPQFPPPGTKLLELGSGAGDSAIPFAEAGYLVSGMEISPTAVNWAKEKFSARGLTGRFVESSVAETWPFPNQSFSSLIDSACLHCIVGEGRKIFFQEARRVLKEDGFLLISTMVGDPKEEIQGMGFDPETRCQIKNGKAYRYMSRLPELIDEVEQSNRIPPEGKFMVGSCDGFCEKIDRLIVF